MTEWRRALGLGLLVWLVPFLASFVAFPLKAAWRSLFESIMPLVLAVGVVVGAALYFRRAPAAGLREGLLLGVLWLLISLVIDLPLMLSPPMSYSLAEYVADIGLSYLMMPVITAGFGFAAALRTEEAGQGDVVRDTAPNLTNL